MKQYIELLTAIKEKGTLKPAAREGMPGTKSLFGYQFRHNLAEGFPLLTTKKINFEHIAVELLWFLKGDTNIKYLLDHNVNIWNEDAYKYYVKLASANDSNWNPVMRDNRDGTLSMYTYEEFVEIIKTCDGPVKLVSENKAYTLGDCGFQYGKVWRDWNGVDQIKNLINGLRNNPQSRRHIITAIDPTHDTDLALYWCHALVQFNARPLSTDERLKVHLDGYKKENLMMEVGATEAAIDQALDERDIPRYALDCQMYQRSADVFLGVPYNIASYALLTHIVATMCNMIPGEFIHTFGDVHIYEDHKTQVDKQMSREPRDLPQLEIHTDISLDEVRHFDVWHSEMFKIVGYNPHSRIKAKLSTGLK